MTKIASRFSQQSIVETSSRWMVVGLLLLAQAAPASVQDKVPATRSTPASKPAGQRTYTAGDFNRFAPKNAADILRQIPGFLVQQVEERRGFGDGGGNVLINGRRISGKSNDALGELARIPARNVTRIEIVDGATLNIPGVTGQVANIIAKAAGAKGQFAWRPQFALRDTSPLLTRGEVSVSGSAGRFDYTAGLRNDASRRRADGETLIYDPLGFIADRREELVLSVIDNPRISGSLKYDGPGDSLGTLNASYGQTWSRGSDGSQRSGLGQIDRDRQLRSDKTGHAYEIGGDYEFGMGAGRLKLIGLHQFDHSPTDSRAITSFANGSPAVGNRFTRVADRSETIARAEYRWKAGSSDWQASVEGALNSLKSQSELFLLGRDGGFRQIPFPGGLGQVSERRAEARLTHQRPLSTKLRLQASVGIEYSSLSVQGDDSSARVFFRPKGFLAATWKPSADLTLNARLERNVGQLDFSDFLASVNLATENRNAGNANLVPPQSWELSVGGIKSLGVYGSTTLTLYGRRYEDLIDIIPVGTGGETPGNVDRALLFGLESRSTLLLGPLGWKGARLDMRLQLQTSSVQDPLTGVQRSISGSTVRLAELSLRYDIPNTDLAWGVQFSHVRPAESYRLGEVFRAYEGPLFANLFVEHKNIQGLTVRATAANLLGADQIMDRYVYVGRRTGPLSFFEQRQRHIGTILLLSVSGSF